MNLQLGVTAIDKITGFRGIVTGLVSYLTGCNQALLTPKAKEPNEFPSGQWLDVQRLEVQDEPVIVIDNGDNNGPDLAPPIR